MQTKKHHLPWDTKHGWVKTFGLVMHVRGCIKQWSLLHLLIAMQRELWPSKCAAFLKHPNNCAACLLPTKNLQATPRGGVLACLLLLCAQLQSKLGTMEGAPQHWRAGLLLFDNTIVSSYVDGRPQTTLQNSSAVVG